MQGSLFLFVLLVLVGCGHTLEFRNNTFFSPVTGNRSWAGNVNNAFTSATPVTVINDITTSPPTRSAVTFEDTTDSIPILDLLNLDPNVQLTLLPSLDIFSGPTSYGIRWQFLGNGPQTGLVAAVQVGTNDRTDSTVKTSQGTQAKSSAKIATSESGLSVGYQFASVAAYVSYVKDFHTVKTTVNNSASSFGPYTDKGEHSITSIGLNKTTTGFYYGIEYSLIQVVWNSTQKDQQYSSGVRLGFAW